MGTAVKTSAGCVWRKIIPLSNTNSGPTPDSNVNVSRGTSTEAYESQRFFDSGCSGHMTGNMAHLEDYQELSKVGSVTFGGSKGSISGKGGLGHLNFKNLNKLVKDNLVRGFTSNSSKMPHCDALSEGNTKGLLEEYQPCKLRLESTDEQF
ncbi:hypothetical protein Tco_1313166 [Tanacetum coccineum]